MKSLGLHTGTDLKKLSELELVRHFGKAGRFYYQIVRGINDRLVEPHQEAKSIGAEDTFPRDLSTLEEMEPELNKLAQTVPGLLQFITGANDHRILIRLFIQRTRPPAVERSVWCAGMKPA